VKLPFEAYDDPEIDPVWMWFKFQLALIGESRASVLRDISSGSNTAEQGRRPHEAQFIGLTRREVEEFFDAQRGQLELLTMFEILATTEAVLRIEVKTRVVARKKDPLSRRFRKLHRAKGDRIRLDEDILAAMNEDGVSTGAIAAFRGALRLRHWLAHGRHWHPKLSRGYTPSDVFDISGIDRFDPTDVVPLGRISFHERISLERRTYSPVNAIRKLGYSAPT
jgi:hypothetical protein